ncbi:MAG TPA: hypothetical protein VN328_04240 [Thermodesulfovibrionales bacterium]|nr:hypothetical protein [Thermodesulfovibrionales bacterium]
MIEDVQSTSFRIELSRMDYYSSENPGCYVKGEWQMRLLNQDLAHGEGVKEYFLKAST